MHDIVADIHGQHEKLTALLARLGYSRRGRWRHAEGRRLVFLGDFIDRGDANEAVLRTVRDLIEDDMAVAVMGNHELNAVHYHNTDPETGAPLRPHSIKNEQQHASFLKEFPPGAERTRAWIDWMAALPLWRDMGEFRAVHAAWSDRAVETLPDGRLPADALHLTAWQGHPLNIAAETLTKGPEVALPAGWRFHDKEGHPRTEMRLAWWRGAAESWAEMAISVPDPGELPPGAPAGRVAGVTYPADEKPVFFGHYWLTGAPELQAENALCLDYSAGIGGPLLAYRWEEGAAGLDPARIVGVD